MNTHGTVDCHAHPVDDVFRREMGILGLDPMAEDGFPLPDWSVSTHQQFMEEAGIDYTVLTVPTPHIHNGDDEKSCASARRINESTAKLCAEYPEKFCFVAASLRRRRDKRNGLCHGHARRSRRQGGDE